MKTGRFSGTKSILCNLLLIALLLVMTGCTTVSEPAMDSIAKEETSESAGSAAGDIQAKEQEVNSAVSQVNVAFDYKHMPTLASNQIAIWAEDSNGRIVKTILVTDFTAKRRGYRNREMTLSGWVSATDPDEMSDAQIDAVSSATPGSGHLDYTWDLTDEAGNRVSDGIYTLILEGTLFWESNVQFKTVINTGQTESRELQAEMYRNEPENHENENMIMNVRFSAVSFQR